MSVAQIVSLFDRAEAKGPDAIGELFWQIHAQPRPAPAWTLEADLRPWAEPF